MDINISAIETSCEVNLRGGHVVELYFRPFTLADASWMQKTFDTEQKRMSLASMAIEEVSRVVWHMLAPESKKTFSNITFKEYDEDSETEIEVKITGHKKLMYSLASQNDLLEMFDAYARSKSLNSFIPEEYKKKIQET